MGKKVMYVCSIMLLNFFCATWLYAAPSITSISGTISDGSTITIAGSGFGTKSTAAPTVWDDCSGTDVMALWSNGVPSTKHGETNATYNLAYRTPAQLGRGVALPHSHITKYLTGAHYSDVGDGSDVMVWKHRAVTSPSYTYVSWYRRIDPNWSWGSGDKNFKDTAWCDTLTAGPYSCNNYTSHYDATSPYYTGIWDANIFSGYKVALAHERLETKWVKTEWETYWSTGTDGYMKIWENGVLKMHYSGRTWTGNGPNCIAIEGFFREVNTNCWRYMADIYLDHSAQRVLIGNANTLAACTTLREVQIPSAWSNTSVTVKVNQGGFADGAVAYLYVFDATGASNATGYAVTFGTGSSADTTAPAKPVGVTLQIQ